MEPSYTDYLINEIFKAKYAGQLPKFLRSIGLQPHSAEIEKLVNADPPCPEKPTTTTLSTVKPDNETSITIQFVNDNDEDKRKFIIMIEGTKTFITSLPLRGKIPERIKTPNKNCHVNIYPYGWKNSLISIAIGIKLLAICIGTSDLVKLNSIKLNPNLPISHCVEKPKAVNVVTRYYVKNIDKFLDSSVVYNSPESEFVSEYFLQF